MQLETYTILFLCTATGLALGNIKFKGVSLGTSSVIFTAILLGHFGMSLPPIFKQIGLILFMYSVGIQAGPGFFEVFKNKKKRTFFYMTFAVIALQVLVTFGAKFLFGYDNMTTAGLYAGALSTSAGLAVAASNEGAEIVSAAFGLAYPFSVLLIVLFMVLSPKLFKIRIKDEEKKYLDNAKAENPDILTRHYTVENQNLFGKTIAEAGIRKITGATVSSIHHNDKEIEVAPDTILKAGYTISASGTPDIHTNLKLLIGHEIKIKKAEVKKYKYITKIVLITNKEAINRSLRELRLSEEYGASVTHIRRSGVDIIPRPHIKLRFGDKITLACPKENSDKLVKMLGGSRSKMNDIDFLPISIGILLGVVLGGFAIPVGDITLKLGLTGGVLISGLILGRIGKTGNIIWNVAGTPNMFLRKIGLIFFLAAVGTDAGAHFVELLKGSGASIILSTVAIVLLPLILVAIAAYKKFKFDYLTILGVLTGSMTSTPGLSAIENVSDTNAARESYAAVYPFALVLVMLVTQILMLLPF
jgi:putative transport protein